MNLSNVSVTGGVTIVNSFVGDVSILGSNQADTIETTITNLNSTDIINGSGGSDTLQFTDSGSISFSQFSGVSSVENLTFYSGVDTLNLSNAGEFNDFKSKFTGNINFGGGSDELRFGDSDGTYDLDFTNVSNLETLSFGAGNDTVTFGIDEFNAGIRTLNLGDGTNTANLNADTSSQVQVNGGNGSDEFVLDFSRINQNDYQLNGGAGSDTVKVMGIWNLSEDMAFASSGIFTNIERIDLSEMTLNGDDSYEFMFTGSLINSWSSSNNISLKLTSDQLENIGYTDSDGNYQNSVTAGTTYNLQDGAQLIIETI